MLVKKTTFHSLKFFCTKRGDHFKRERMKIIDPHLKGVFLRADTTKKPPPIPQIMAIFRYTSRDMPRNPSEVPGLL